MSRFRCDIRRLLPRLPRRILEAMAQRSTTGLEFCLACRQDFVSMVRCTRSGTGTWWLLLRCGGCGTWHETFDSDEAVAGLRRAIDGMGSQIEAFSQALQLDLIDADDFQIARDSPG
jgi:hypothetical protein